ncbi:branched-chain amino acid transport system permease protein [Rhodoligotrophos appendicifer]|uniref:branched-chain amino acid ABC transporter permease n=1 Tax=Rhodoligotrophos appendicifer TaxID=987056 RepID=UPI0011867B21|nr:branched-chain amino acid ABC transporter permease [Rhodoligotrophos appendicifer]
MLAQQILNGVVVGCIYALFSLGFTLIFGVMNIMNLAHGAIFMCGAFVGLYALTLADLPIAVAFGAAIIAGGLVSMLLDFVAFRPLRARGGDEFGAVVSSIGAGLVIISVAQQVSDAQIMSFPFGSFPVVIYKFLGLRISLLQLTVIGITAVSLIFLYFYVYRTSMGRKIRAISVNEGASLILGINPASVYAQIFFIAGAFAGAAGFIIGLTFNSVQFLMGESIMLRGFVVVILGGLGSIPGAIAAGISLGIVQTLLVTYVSSELSDAILFALLFLTLLLHPTGFFKGLRSEMRVVRQ